ncbi:MAG: dihydrodipicolinate synthase family protein [Clostridia bacterium]|nr:dihydrodipicolinate synthase family protein [Clostridia bacterium]
MKKYRGVFPALYTCYDSEGHIDPRGVRSMARYLCQSGVSGILVNGKPGADPGLTVREKVAVMENVMVQAAGQALVLCQIGCEGTEECRELLRRTAECGADAAVVLRPREWDGLPALLDAWRRAADIAGNTDMIFCDFPIPLTDEDKRLFADFGRDTRMKGIIVPEGGSTAVVEYRQVFGNDISLFATREAEFEMCISRGADALIGYLSALIPEICVRLESSLRFNTVRHASEDGTVIRSLAALMDACSAPAAVAREVLKTARGVDCGYVRSPRPEMTPEDRERAAECIRIIRSLA